MVFSHFVLQQISNLRMTIVAGVLHEDQTYFFKYVKIYVIRGKISYTRMNQQSPQQRFQ